MFKILYLEDDINLSNTITEFLEDNSFNVTVVYTGNEALEELYKCNFDLLLFDVNLPDVNGFDLLKDLRDININTPTIFTTTLNDIDSLDKGYISGADDYLRKPFSLKELIHRINTLLKRNFSTQNNKFNFKENIIFEINTGLLFIDNKDIKLNQKEVTLLKLFIQYKNEIIPLNVFYETVWNTKETHSEGSLRTYIKNIRKFLGKDTIQSIKKQGYKLVV